LPADAASDLLAPAPLAVRVLFVALALLGALALVAGCSGPTQLSVTVQGKVALSRLWTDVASSSNGNTEHRELKDAGHAPQLPLSFLVLLDDVPTRLTVSVGAITAAGQPLTASQIIAIAPHARATATLSIAPLSDGGVDLSSPPFDMTAPQMPVPDLGRLSYAAVIEAAHPQLYYRLDEAAGSMALVDQSGHGRGGSVHNGVALGEPGLLSDAPDRSDTAARFVPAMSTYLTADDASALRPTTTMTLEAWIKPNAFVIAQDYQRLVHKGMADETGFAWYLPGNDTMHGRLGFEMAGVNSGMEVDGKRQMAVGETHYVVVTYDGSSVRFYVDGVLDATNPVSGTPASDTNSFNIGRRGDNSCYYDGVLDELAYYNRVLSADEIAMHYQVGSTQ
jgi:hypothetical protein